MSEGGPSLGGHLRHVDHASRALLNAHRRYPTTPRALIAELGQEFGLTGPPPWGPVPSLETQEVATVAFAAAVDHLGAFADDVAEDREFAALASCRSGLEACAVVGYLAEPGIGARERIRRGVNEQLLGLKDTRSFWRSVAAKDHPAFVEATEHRDALLKIGSSLGYVVKDHQLGAPRPRVAALVEHLFVEADVGRAVYRLLVTSTRSRPATVVSAGHDPRRRLPRRPVEMALLSSILLLGLRTSTGCLANLAGWEIEPWMPVWHAAFQVSEAGRT